MTGRKLEAGFLTLSGTERPERQRLRVVEQPLWTLGQARGKIVREFDAAS
jgi:hypothetical protein